MNQNWNKNLRLIGRGSFGSVYEIGDSKKFVLKTMKIENQKDLNIFMNEVETGHNEKIRPFGPYIYKWRIIKDGTEGQYIMDNVLLGEKEHRSVTLHAFLRGACPDEQLSKKILSTVEGFWRATGRRHGDLHSGNIMVIKDKNGEIVRLMVVDYGASKKLSKNYECINTVIRNNFENFVNSYKKGRHNYNYNTKTQKFTNVARFHGDQIRRSNIGMLRHYLGVKPGGGPPKNLLNRVKHLPNKVAAASLGVSLAEYQKLVPPKPRGQVNNALLSQVVGGFLFN